MSTPHLLLVLQAPMLAYGDEAIDRRRPTDIMPGLSMLTGLLGNALGYRRQDADKLEELQTAIRYAARTERQYALGIIRDFHTARLGINDKAWTAYGRPESRAGDRKNPYVTETREVDYLTESVSIVALTIEEGAGAPSTEELAEAVRNPARPLFIGRKCCIPERPIFEEIVSADSTTEALYSIPAVTDGTEAQVQWDDEEQHESIRPTHVIWVSDIKDWRNGVHVGRRQVMRGVQTLRPA